MCVYVTILVVTYLVFMLGALPIWKGPQKYAHEYYTLLRTAIPDYPLLVHEVLICTTCTHTRLFITPQGARRQGTSGVEIACMLHVVGCQPLNSKSIRTIVNKATLWSVASNFRQWECCIACRCCTEEPCLAATSMNI